jgi:hypothetical protein
MAGNKNQRARHHFKGRERAAKAQRKQWKRQGRCEACGMKLTDPSHVGCAGIIARPGE